VIGNNTTNEKDGATMPPRRPYGNPDVSSLYTITIGITSTDAGNSVVGLLKDITSSLEKQFTDPLLQVRHSKVQYRHPNGSIVTEITVEYHGDILLVDSHVV
jgi:hypothetical protein